MKKLIRLGMVQFICGAVLVGLVTYWLMYKPTVPHGVTPVKQGVLYRSGQLEPQQLRKEIHRRGIRTIVNLGSGIDTDEAVCRELGVRYVEVPVEDIWRMCGVPGPHKERKPSDPVDLTFLWKLIDNPETRPVLVHCWGGIHRTGVVVAKYRMKYEGWDPDDAIAEMDLFGFGSSRPKFAELLRVLRSSPPPAAAGPKPGAR